MPSNKKQRGREQKEKRNQAQQEAKKAADEQQAQQDAEEARVQQELAIGREEVEKSFQRRQLQGLFGTPAIDQVIQEVARSISITTTAVAGAAAASKPASSSSSTTPPDVVIVCYHGSSAEHFFADSKYLQMVTSYVSLWKKFGGKDQWKDTVIKFMNDKGNRNVYLVDGFTNFVFALAVELYLKSSSEERERYYNLPSRKERIGTAMFELEKVLDLVLVIKYVVVPSLDKTQSQQKKIICSDKSSKYRREIDTERGLIKFLHRETSQYCYCMASKNDEAKGMGKMERCRTCRRESLKKLMKKCDECEMVVYCSKKCQIKHWPCHQIVCEKQQKLRAANGNNN